MSEAKKGSPKIALNMSMVKTIMWTRDRIIHLRE